MEIIVIHFIHLNNLTLARKMMLIIPFYYHYTRNFLQIISLRIFLKFNFIRFLIFTRSPSLRLPSELHSLNWPMSNHPSPTFFFKSILSMNWKSFPESLKFSFKVNLLDLLIQLKSSSQFSNSWPNNLYVVFLE